MVFWGTLRWWLHAFKSVDSKIVYITHNGHMLYCLLDCISDSWPMLHAHVTRNIKAPRKVMISQYFKAIFCGQLECVTCSILSDRKRPLNLSNIMKKYDMGRYDG